MIKSQEFEFSNNNIGDCCWRFGAESSTLNLDSNGMYLLSKPTLMVGDLIIHPYMAWLGLYSLTASH